MSRISPLISAQHTSFRSDLIDSTKIIRDVKKAKDLVDLAFNNKAFEIEFATWVTKMGGIQSPELWNEYFLTYDQTVAFSNGYLDLIAFASRILPESGQIIDYGSGTGNFSTGMMALVPSRTLLALDFSSVGLERTGQKMSIINSGNQWSTQQVDLIKYATGKGNGTAVGAMMNNVLYTLPAKEKISVLKRIHSDLKDDGTFFLSDPKAGVQESMTELQSFITTVAIDAINNGSLMSEADLVLLAAINKKVLALGAPPFSTRQELVQIAKEAGFDWQHGSDGYYGQATTLGLRKQTYIDSILLPDIKAADFYNALQKTNSPRTLEKRSLSELNQIKEKGGRFYLSRDGKLGIGITAEGEAISGFNMTQEPGLFRLAMQKAIREGAQWIQIINEPKLIDYYQQLGFHFESQQPLPLEKYPQVANSYALSEKPMLLRMKLPENR